MKKLFLHYGIHRTGTTSVQRNLKSNYACLEDQGISYPDLGVGRRHQKIAWGLASGKISLNDFVKRLISETSNSHSVVLSAEDFCQIRDASWLVELKRHFDVSVVIYLKRQDKWLESWYNQHVKWPWVKKFSSSTPEEFLSNMSDFFWLDYDAMLSQLESVLNKENVYCKAVGGHGVKDTLADILNVIGADDSFFEFQKMTNQSLSKCQLDVVRHLNLIDIPAPKRIRIINAVKNISIQNDDGSKKVFDSLQCQSIAAHYSPSNQNLITRYPQLEQALNFPESFDHNKVNCLNEREVFNSLLDIVKKLA